MKLLILNRFYEFIFKRPIPDKLKSFLNNFGYLVLAEIIGSIIGFPIKILVGRFLGPEQYGNYALILNLTQFFVIPMIFGLTTSTVKYVASENNKKDYINFTYFLVSLTVFISSILLIIFKEQVLWIFKIPETIFWWTLIFSIFYTYYYIFESFVRGLHRFKLIAWINIINSIVLLIVFLFNLFVRQDRTFIAFISANIFAFLVTSLIYLHKIKPKWWSFEFTKDVKKNVFSYSRFAVIGAITGALISNTDRFFLNNYTSLVWVGIYSAYVNGANLFVGRLSNLFIQVYFPTVSAYNNKSELFTKLLKVLLVLSAPIFLISIITIFIVLLLFGSEFPIIWPLVLLFSLNNVIFIYQQTFMWLLNAQGIKGIKSTTVINIIASVINLVLFFFLIRLFGVYGAIISTLIINFLLAIFIYLRSSVLIMRGQFDEN